ncbi:MAG: DUF294 nucleotidyltransferase-like domain-containing protein [Pseudomonadota bacterium]
MEPFALNTERFLRELHPYETLSEEQFTRVVEDLKTLRFKEGEAIYTYGEVLDGIYIIAKGNVEITLPDGSLLSSLREKNSFGERGLMKDGLAATTAKATSETTLLLLPKTTFDALFETHEPFRKFFTRSRAQHAQPRPNALTSTLVEDLMTADPVSCSPETSVVDAARLMRDKGISSLVVTDDARLKGIVTLRDISKKIVAEGLPSDGPVSDIMTLNPLTLQPGAIGSDVLHFMIERGIGHVPIASAGKVLGIVTQTNLTRFQADNSATLVHDIAKSQTVSELAGATKHIPQLLATLVGSGNRHDVVTRLVTDVADAVTRRLLKLSERELGTAPVPYLWLACGSQGRQEQAGISDQDNCMILDDSATDDDKVYFERLANFVCDGLNACGYVYCPGDMMAKTERWRQTRSVWQSYFDSWITNPDKQAQMLASVMFDLRSIGGTHSLYDKLQEETLAKASKNSIFVAHMVSNSVTHQPPLGLLRGFATLRSGEHKHHIDLKLNGVVPIVDLGRIYALRGQIKPVNTRARLTAARDAGTVSMSGGHDLLDAYDLIAETRLQHQARLIRQGEKADNFMRPTVLSEFERSHLRDAFVVVRTMQAAAGQGHGVL